jgi:hypothetical protein
VRLALGVAVLLAVARAAGECAARILEVGPLRGLKTPSAAARIAAPGDVVRIDAGTYRDCAVWRTPDLTIEGVGGYAHVRDTVCDVKAIWVFYASPVRIRHVRFSGASSVRRNAAGIRWEGNGLPVVEDGWFDGNQMGILTHNREASRLVVDRSRFDRNGDCEKFCGHAVDAGFIGSATVRESTFTGHRFGHSIKSRALVSEIVGNRIGDGPGGTSSYAINLPNGGTAIIRRNVIAKGPGSYNPFCAICIGEEIAPPGEPVGAAGRANPSRGIRIEGNYFTNGTGNPDTAFVWNRSPHTVSLSGNSLSGAGIRYVAGPRPELEKKKDAGGKK